MHFHRNYVVIDVATGTGRSAAEILLYVGLLEVSDEVLSSVLQSIANERVKDGK